MITDPLSERHVIPGIESSECPRAILTMAPSPSPRTTRSQTFCLTSSSWNTVGCTPPKIILIERNLFLICRESSTTLSISGVVAVIPIASADGSILEIVSETPRLSAAASMISDSRPSRSRTADSVASPKGGVMELTTLQMLPRSILRHGLMKTTFTILPPSTYLFPSVVAATDNPAL